ncbi:MAG TPA: universal stress protein [bacterium]|nr:universal stress protein [bacterium]
MKLLVATDGSPHATRAAALAARLARELTKTEVFLVTVGHIPAFAMGGPGPDAMVDLEIVEQGLEQAGHAVLDAAKRQFDDIGVPVTAAYRMGDPSLEIVKAAQEAGADMIILGSRGLGQIGGLILGSVSERVLHAAHIPVLVVR